MKELAFSNWLLSVKLSLGETFIGYLVCSNRAIVIINRALKKPRRRRRQERHKFTNLTMKNSCFLRFVRAIFIFVHFAFVLILSTTRNHLLRRCVDLTTNFQFFSPFSFPNRSRQFNSGIVITFISSQTIGIVEKWLQKREVTFLGNFLLSSI